MPRTTRPRRSPARGAAQALEALAFVTLCRCIIRVVLTLSLAIMIDYVIINLITLSSACAADRARLEDRPPARPARLENRPAAPVRSPPPPQRHKPAPRRPSRAACARAGPPVARPVAELLDPPRNQWREETRAACRPQPRRGRRAARVGRRPRSRRRAEPAEPPPLPRALCPARAARASASPSRPETSPRP